MNCPVCNVELRMTDRQGIEIDYCPQCRGVWLDRGELDKLIERAAPKEDARDYRRDERRDQHRHGHESYKHHKKKSIWGEIFDF